ncbi:MAG: endonuclease V [Peptococcaceae bacterium]|nr:endonuclease V [Peptococcaceae bacterium]
MELKEKEKFDILESQFAEIQRKLADKINLVNRLSIKDIDLISGVDLAYWESKGKEYAVCCIVMLSCKTREIVEMKYLSGEVTVPYVAGYLSFRELPLILETYKLLENNPDVIMFDGNGYLHYRNMGIATHASFYLNKPTIGVAKSYLKIDNVDYMMPEDKVGAFTDIIINGKVYGRALRTHKGVRPIFVSCGNWIDLDTATELVLDLIDKESHLPMIIRKADIETRKQRSKLMSQPQ